MQIAESFEYEIIIQEIGALNWEGLSRADMVAVAWAYYFFSVQFRESLGAARGLYPDDDKLLRLEQEECDTDNLSPWPGVAQAGERMNHDEYMRRTLELVALDRPVSRRLEVIGQSYLEMSRALPLAVRAASIASYEDGGLERVFTAMLRFADWENELLGAFQHFLVEHVRFDSDPEQGHGALSRHIIVDDRILPLWQGFKNLLVTCVPALAVHDESALPRIHDIFPLGAVRLDTDTALHEAVGLLPACDDPVCHP